MAFVALDATGERSFSFYRPPAADLLFRSSHVHPNCFAGTRSFHVCSNSLTEAEIAEATLDGMRRARAAGAMVSIDLNLRPALWPAGVDPLPRLWEALQLAELVKLSREELDYLAAAHAGGGDAVIARLLGAQAQAVVMEHDWFAPPGSMRGLLAKLPQVQARLQVQARMRAEQRPRHCGSWRWRWCPAGHWCCRRRGCCSSSAGRRARRPSRC